MEVTPFSARRGFTLIETVISIGIFALLAILVTQAFLQLTTINDRVKTDTRVKQEGDAVLNAMLRDIRNAQEVQACATNSISVTDRSVPAQTIIFSLNATTKKLMVKLGAATEQAMTSADTSVTAFTVTCETVAGAVKMVNLSFTLEQTAPAAVSMSFSGGVGLRNY